MDGSKVIDNRREFPQNAFQKKKKKDNLERLTKSDEAESSERFNETRVVFDQNEMKLKKLNNFGGKKVEHSLKRTTSSMDESSGNFLKEDEDDGDSTTDENEISIEKQRLENEGENTTVKNKREFKMRSRKEKGNLFSPKSKNENFGGEKGKDRQTQETQVQTKHKYIYISHPHKSKKTEVKNEDAEKDNNENGNENELKNAVSFEIFESSAKHSNKKKRESKTGQISITVNKN